MKTKIIPLVFALCIFFATSLLADDPPTTPTKKNIPEWLGPPDGLNPPGFGIDQIDYTRPPWWSYPEVGDRLTLEV